MKWSVPSGSGMYKSFAHRSFGPNTTITTTSAAHKETVMNIKNLSNAIDSANDRSNNRSTAHYTPSAESVRGVCFGERHCETFL